MAAKGNEEGGGDSVAAKPEKAKPDEARKYSQERLIEEAEAFFGESSHVVAGALHDRGGDLTLERAQRYIEDWKAKVVS